MLEFQTWTPTPALYRYIDDFNYGSCLFLPNANGWHWPCFVWSHILPGSAWSGSAMAMTCLFAKAGTFNPRTAFSGLASGRRPWHVQRSRWGEAFPGIGSIWCSVWLHRTVIFRDWVWIDAKKCAYILRIQFSSEGSKQKSEILGCPLFEMVIEQA